MRFAKVLVITAHHDDLELGCGGLVYEWSRNGTSVFHAVCAAPTWKDRPRSALMKSGKAARDLLGHRSGLLDLAGPGDPELLFPPDPPPAENEAIVRLEELLEFAKADLIITQSPNSTQTGHRYVGQVVLSAARRASVVWLMEPMFPDAAPFRSQVYVPIGQAALEAKLDSLMLYQESDGVRPELVAAARTRAELRGYEAGWSFAECFEVSRWVM